jgi:tetratricopeptide (TPR) repeat protein
MRQVLSCCSRVPGFVFVVVLTEFNLLAQTNVCPGLRIGNQPGDMCSDSMSVWVKPEPANGPGAGSPTVTRQQLRHVVPKKAQKELEKAENARIMNRREEAIDHLNKAIRLDPEFVAARNNLAALYLRMDNPEPAIAQLEEAVKVDPDDPIVFMNLTISYIISNRIEAAERAARVTVDLDRVGTLPQFLLGFTLVHEHKFTDEALRCLERTRNQYPLAHLLTARLLVGRNKLEPAKSEIRNYLSGPDQNDREIATSWLDAIEQNEQKNAAVDPR